MPDYLIICAGSTTKYYKKKIDKLIELQKWNPWKTGVNNVFHLGFDLDYSLWTNYKRFKKFCWPLLHNEETCNKVPSLIVGEKLSDQWVEEDGCYCCKEVIEDNIKKWRTAGCRAIQYAHDNKANKIYVVGMDGYTLKYEGNQHCYGTGNTDSNDMEMEAEKDEVICNCLRRMKSEGVNFEIITPTIYLEFYNGSVL